MNEIRNNNINLSTTSLGQIQHMVQASPARQADELEIMLNRTLGSSSASSAQSNELSLDVILSGSLSGYLGVGDIAMNGLESPIASAQILSSPSMVAAELPSDKEPAIPLAKLDSNIKEQGAIKIAKVDFEGKKEAIKIAKVDFEGPVNAIKIARLNTENSPQLARISQESSPLSALPSETLSSVAFSMEVNELALGLVPGEHFSPSQSQAIAAVLETDAPGIALENKGDELAVNLNVKSDTLAFALPSETIAAWDNTNAVSLSGNEVALDGGLKLEVPESLSAAAFEKGEDFDARTLASLPVLEGNRDAYKNAWANISDTLSSYENGTASGVIGLADFNGASGINPPALGLNIEPREDSVAGIAQTLSGNELLSHRSFVNSELLGYAGKAAYSSLAGFNLNPTSIVSALNPGKYLSNLINGYNA